VTRLGTSSEPERASIAFFRVFVFIRKISLDESEVNNKNGRRPYVIEKIIELGAIRSQ
jgi:hypothetical protein